MDKQSSLEELLRRNLRRALHHEPIPTFADMMQQQLEKQQPMPKIFIVVCDDPRVDAREMFGLGRWEAVVASNAAGRIAPQLESLIFLDSFLQFTDIMIIHHTDCSCSIFENAKVRRQLQERVQGHSSQIEQLWLPGYADLEQGVRDDVELVRSSPLIRKELADRTQGFVYDMTTGKVNSVDI
ncbi:carbonic anhydrase [Thozetella sp. PMI_491]|nr:carbonic anhydrase [Thozetella sp. PMI_491]